jgi:hypothetical protein
VLAGFGMLAVVMVIGALLGGAAPAQSDNGEDTIMAASTYPTQIV